LEQEGQTYYFCSRGCRREFEEQARAVPRGGWYAD